MAELFEKYSTLFNKNGLTTHLRICHFMAQIEHESNLTPISENLHYSAEGLRRIFPKYFPTNMRANRYANKPKEIANYVYANRMGNGNEISGDGYRFRGRGFIQLTGKENYTKLHIDTGLDCINNPDLLLEEPNAMISALWFWNKNKLNILADNDNIEGITKKINGGLHGIENRKKLLQKYKNELL